MHEVLLVCCLLLCVGFIDNCVLGFPWGMVSQENAIPDNFVHVIIKKILTCLNPQGRGGFNKV